MTDQSLKPEDRALFEEGLAICRDMVKAEDELIADLQANGQHEELLKIDFPIMHRMRAFVARADKGIHHEQ